MTAHTGGGNARVEAEAYPFPFWLHGGVKFVSAVKQLTSGFYYPVCFYCSFMLIRKEDARLIFTKRTGDLSFQKVYFPHNSR